MWDPMSLRIPKLVTWTKSKAGLVRAKLKSFTVDRLDLVARA